MVRIESRSVHGRGISAQAKSVLHAAVSYAERTKETAVHNMLLADFCTLCGLDVDTSRQRVVQLMTQAGRAVVSVEVADATRGRKQVVATGSWPVFLSILVTNTHISFEVCRYAWDEMDFGPQQS